MDIFDKLKDISAILDELDEFGNNIPTNQQHFDYKLSDLYHKLENMSLSLKNCYKFCKELKEVLLERRKLKNNVALFQKYDANKAKLNNGMDNRKILLSLIATEEKQLNQPYKNRVYTDEELNERIDGK